MDSVTFFNWTSPFSVEGVPGVFCFYFYFIVIRFLYANMTDPNQTPLFATFDLGLHCLSICPFYGTVCIYGLRGNIPCCSLTDSIKPSLQKAKIYHVTVCVT